jgi:glycosyltransferase involved in cell wall biosynthesis
MKKKRVLYFLNSNFGTIGSNASVMIPKYAKKSGVDIKVVARGDLDEAMCTMDDGLCDKNLEFYGSKNKLFQMAFLFKIIRKIDPDIVHVFWHPLNFIFPVLFSIIHFAKKKPKWVLDIRSPAVQTGKRSTIKRMLDPIKQLGFDCVFTSEINSAYTQLRKIWKPLYVLPPGYEPDMIKPVIDTGKFPKIIRLIYVGSVTRTREFDKLLSIFFRVSENTDIDFTLDIFGDGDYVPSVIERVKLEGLQEKIRYRGLISQNELFTLIPEYHVGIAYIPYKNYRFAHPLKTIEYIVSGLYVLGSDTEGNKNFIVNNRVGKLSSNDEREFSKLISDYIISPVRPSYKPNIIKDLSWRKIVEDILLPKYEEISALK